MPRRRFPESPVLACSVDREMEGLAISEGELRSGQWVGRLDELSALQPRSPMARHGPLGAEVAADAIARYLAGESGPMG